METANNPDFNPTPQTAGQEQASQPKETKNRGNAANAAKVAAGAIGGAAVTFIAEGAEINPDIIDGGNVMLDQAAQAAEALNTPVPSQYHTPVIPEEDNEENSQNTDEEDFNVEDIRLELDDLGEIVSTTNSEDLPEIVEVDPAEIIYDEDDAPYIYSEDLPEVLLADETYVDDISPLDINITDEDLAFDDTDTTDDIIDIL